MKKVRIYLLIAFAIASIIFYACNKTENHVDRTRNDLAATMAADVDVQTYYLVIKKQTSDVSKYLPQTSGVFLSQDQTKSMVSQTVSSPQIRFLA